MRLKMLISDKLKSFDFTYAEKEIVKYFLNQKEEIARQSTREISKRLYCSPSSAQEAIHTPHTGVGYYTTTVARTSINLVSLVLFIVLA